MTTDDDSMGALLTAKVMVGGLLCLGFLVVGILSIVYSCFATIDQTPMKDLDPPKGFVFRKYFFIAIGE